MAVAVPVTDLQTGTTSSSPRQRLRLRQQQPALQHPMLELTGEPEKRWHYTIFGDKPDA